MAQWSGDDDLFAICRKELFTAVIGDICDMMGLRRQFLPAEIRPIGTGRPVPLLIGRAMPVLEEDLSGEESPAAPFGLMLDALDNLKRNEIYVCTGGSRSYALVGELMSTAMIARGALGAICDGYIRDTEGIERLSFSVYARGSFAQDQRGRGAVTAYRKPIVIGQAQIEPGDVLVADIDGALVVPQRFEKEVFEGAIEKARAEKEVQQAIAGGMLAKEAFARYGIL